MRKRNILFSLILLGTFSVGLSSCNITSTSTSFTIIWKNHDGTILDVDIVNYGTTPTYDGENPLKENSDSYTYTFSGWSPEIAPATSNAIYTAQFTSLINQYLITFKNYDGELLQSSNWAHGTTPVYSETTPIKPSDSQYSYTFSGWSPEIAPATSNATYTAQFTDLTKEYLITFKNYDGTSLQSSNWAYGSIPVYSETTPTRPDSSQYSLVFSGWYPEVVPVKGNATYTAFFNGKYYLGSYPQTKVTDTNLITTLNDSSGVLPTSANSQSWTPYNYYIEGSNTTKFMWYKDISVGEDLYRGVYFTLYRPLYTDGSSSTIGNSDFYQYVNGYGTKFRYWFKFEPISWDVLSIDEDAGPLVLSSKTIDSQDYYHSLDSRTIDGETVYPNNYKESNVRSWLNNSFINTAFSPTEQNLIKTTNVDNSVYSTGYETNQYATTNTDDKLFLPSYRDAMNGDYGFINYASRVRSATDYAKAMGLFMLGHKTAEWWFRSPFYDDELATRCASGVDEWWVSNTCFGILPAFRIDQ